MISQDWPTEAVYPNPNNPRSHFRDDPDFGNLVASIKSQGIIQPLLINKDGMILAGHRRYAVALDLHMQRVPVRIVPDKINHTLVPLIENLQRADLSVMDVAKYLLVCQREHDLTVPAMSEITGISGTTIRQYIRLAEAPAEIRERVERDEITLGAAIALLGHDEGFIREVIKEPNLTRTIVRERAKAHRAVRAVVNTAPMSRRCPCELRPHLEYAISAVREMLEAAPTEDFAVRYRRWIRVLEDDFADMSGDTLEPSFAGSISTFQRPPKAINS